MSRPASGRMRAARGAVFLIALLALWLGRAPAVDEGADSQARQVPVPLSWEGRGTSASHLAHRRAVLHHPDGILAALRYRRQLRLRAERRALASLHRDLRLHAVGAGLYTAWNQPVTLKALNWYGFEYAPFVPDGLDRARLDTVLSTLRTLGFNALRLTFANETVERNPVVRVGLDANPELRGLHALDIMQRIIHRAGQYGVRVILVNSRSEAGRGPELVSGMWYTNEYPESSWIADWKELVTRLRGETAFVGADLRNEPHIVGGKLDQNGYFNNGPLWGAYQGTYYQDRDWHYAAQTLGNALLDIDPHVLIIVEGVQMYLDPDRNVLTGGLWGSNLIGVQYDPVVLSHPSQLVYSIHEYGPQMWQGDWFNLHTTYASLAARWDELWGYLLHARKLLQAPIFVGEFGTCHEYYSCTTSGAGWKQGFWFQSFVRYLSAHPQVGWAYWALNPAGPFHPQDVDFYGLVTPSWRHYYPLVTHGLAPLLREPDGLWRGSPRPVTAALSPQPGCSPNRSCSPAMAGVPAGGATNVQRSPPPVTGMAVRLDVPYVQPTDRYRTGDLYLPRSRSAQLHPAVILIHGPSWAEGGRGAPAMRSLATSLARHGFVAYDIGYRLTGQGGGFPNDIADVKDAAAYLAANAKALGIDPTKLAAVGADSGAYLALMAAYTPNAAPFLAPHAGAVRPHLAAVGSFYAPLDLARIARRNADPALLADLNGYLGSDYGHRPDLFVRASPITYAGGGVPTIFFQGLADRSVRFRPAFDLYLALRQRNVRSQLIDLPGSPHGMAALTGAAWRTAVTQLVEFLDGAFYAPPWHGGH